MPVSRRSFRIEEIPLDDLDTLEDRLKLISRFDPELLDAVRTLTRDSLVRRRKPEPTATVTVTVSTSIPVDDLCSRLQQAGVAYPYRFDSRFLGITALCEDEHGASVDVIAVPGLGSHALGSWKSPNNDDVWLRDYLPGDIPNIRVLLYGHDMALRRGVDGLAVDLLEKVEAFRAYDGTNRRPIVFICHSLGGILVKKALVQAVGGDTELSTSFYATLLFGVPHLGLSKEQLTTVIRGSPNKDLIRDLTVKKNSEPSAFLDKMLVDFATAYKGRCKVVSFFERRCSETIKVPRDGTLQMTGRLSLLVTKNSASSTGLTTASDEDNIPLDTDHSGLVKYESRSQGYYPIVRQRLKILVSEAETEVPKRFTDN